ncbi:multiple organellar RNA editing factor 8, chloroplastic/mitochondrial-like [Iris pallida]|uniref:Multiple organellar RNA editing factor 8, chloroplastic/mitochondrial-like n=1 Tax=Iris pallida TaxID=29817 RepID=A0AAX6HNH3_IRIPA|nr:multiple organellar RNA editing factor 8, chloroplastic/mitochondrial-like [Iris pallida]
MAMATRTLISKLASSISFPASSSSFTRAQPILFRSSFLLRLRPVSTASPLLLLRLPAAAAPRSFSTRPSTSSLNDPSPNWSNRPPKETILLDGCDFEHWLVVVEPPEPNLTRDEIIDSYIKTLAQVLGSEEEARKSIYSVSTKHYFAFGCIVSEELSYKIKTLPKVRWVLPDSYLDVKNKDYGGEPFIDGKAVPYDPKYHEEWVRNNARANERSRRNDRPRNFDRSRNFERRRENMQNRDFQNREGPPMPNQGFQNTMPPHNTTPPPPPPNVAYQQPPNSNFQGPTPGYQGVNNQGYQGGPQSYQGESTTKAIREARNPIKESTTKAIREEVAKVTKATSLGEACLVVLAIRGTIREADLDIKVAVLLMVVTIIRQVVVQIIKLVGLVTNRAAQIIRQATRIIRVETCLEETTSSPFIATISIVTPLFLFNYGTHLSHLIIWISTYLWQKITCSLN